MPEDFTEEQVQQMVEDIEQHDDANRSISQNQEEQTPEETIASDLKFKTLDDLLKYELEYKSDGGKQIREDIATILKRASGGYHYSQNMNKYNALMEEYNTQYAPKIEEASKLQEKYGKFEAYAKENPEWYDHWNSAWENRHTTNQNTDGVTTQQDPNIQAMLKDMLAEQLSPIQEFMQSQQQKVTEQKMSEEDRALADAVNKTREQFKSFDFDATDPETGKSLEYQTLEFMQKTGIQDFNTAFKAMYHDQIVKAQVDQAREQQLKAEQERKKNGIIDIKTTPSTRRTPNLQGKNYDQLIAMAEQDPEIFGAG